MGHEPGKRVGVILKIIDNEVRFLGWGTYLGDFVPPKTSRMKRRHNKIQLDNGEIVWAFQCLAWGWEDETKLFLADKQVVEVDINNKPKRRSI